MKSIRIWLFILASIVLVSETMAVDNLPFNPVRAKYHYQLYCQGCHTPDGSGGGGVPKLKEHMGRFLSTIQGREYMVRVPGAANSVLSSYHLAEVLNWMLLEFSGKSMPKDFTPYTASEVGELRLESLLEVTRYRQEILAP